MARALAFAIWLALTAGPTRAECRLALALAFDVSHSVSAVDYQIQRDGIVAALRAPDIRRAFMAPGGGVALAIFEWGGQDFQDLVLDWTMIASDAELDRVAALMAAHQQTPVWQPTALGSALIFGDDLLARAPDCAQQTLDVSGDGRNNDGIAPAKVFAERPFAGVTVNGLSIGDHEADITSYYRAEVMRGAGAFVVAAHRHTDFPQVIRMKLERELSAPVIGLSSFARRPEG